MSTKTTWFRKAAAITMMASAGTLTIGALPAMADDGPSIDFVSFDPSPTFPVDTPPIDTISFDPSLSFPTDTAPISFDPSLSFPTDTPPSDTISFDPSLSFPTDTAPSDTISFDPSLTVPIDTTPLFDPSSMTDPTGVGDLTLPGTDITDPSVSLDIVAEPKAPNTDSNAGEVLLAGGIDENLKRCLAIAGMTIALCKGVQGLPENPANIPSLPPGNVPADIVKADEERKKREKEAADAAAAGNAKPNEFLDGLGNAFNVLADGTGKFFVVIGGIAFAVFLGPFGWQLQ
jgi:hypothetical protein